MTRIISDALIFLEQVMEPNVDEFVRNPKSFRLAFNAATSLYHFPEWLFETRKEATQKALSQKLCKTKNFTINEHNHIWRVAECLVEDAGFIRDLANSSKHVRLNRSGATSVTHIANTTIQTSITGGNSRPTDSTNDEEICMQDGERYVSVISCVNAVFKFWCEVVSDMPK